MVTDAHARMLLRAMKAFESTDDEAGRLISLVLAALCLSVARATKWDADPLIDLAEASKRITLAHGLHLEEEDKIQ